MRMGQAGKEKCMFSAGDRGVGREKEKEREGERERERESVQVCMLKCANVFECICW